MKYSTICRFTSDQVSNNTYMYKLKKITRYYSKTIRVLTYLKLSPSVINGSDRKYQQLTSSHSAIYWRKKKKKTLEFLPCGKSNKSWSQRCSPTNSVGSRQISANSGGSVRVPPIRQCPGGPRVLKFIFKTT